MAGVYENYSSKKGAKNVSLGNIRPEVLKKRFIELYCNTGNVKKTCDMLGIIYRTFYKWKADDAEFLKEFEEADRIALGLLEDEAHLRAVYGIDKPVYQSGRLVGYIKEYSDTLLMFLLKAKAPHKFRDRFVPGGLTDADGKLLNNELKIVHVHSNIPLALAEEEINRDYITFEEIPKLKLSNEFDDLM